MTRPEAVLELFSRELVVANLGLASFATSLRQAGATAIEVDWRPSAGGNLAVLAALDACLEADGTPLPAIATANQEAVGRLLRARPGIVGLGRAAEVIPGMHKNLVLHSGPPVEWARMSGPTRGAVMGGLVYEGLAA
ncbi:MAG: hypothetical protein V1750_09790, partial [Acidobacteriota bacterium]